MYNTRTDLIERTAYKIHIVWEVLQLTLHSCNGCFVSPFNSVKFSQPCILGILQNSRILNWILQNWSLATRNSEVHETWAKILWHIILWHEEYCLKKIFNFTQFKLQSVCWLLKRINKNIKLNNVHSEYNFYLLKHML